MTNIQNVTEFQPRMTREQLVDAARTAAKLLPVASAQLMNELASRLDYTSVALCESMDQRKALAVENVVLRDDVTCWARECDRVVERHTKSSTNMHLLEAQKELRELTPVTDSIIFGIRSEGVNFAASRLAAAFNNGFINKPITEVSDVVSAILTSKEELSNEPATDGLSGEYAERALKDWASKINGGDQ